MSNNEKINQLLSGIMCEYNLQHNVYNDLKGINGCSYPFAFKNHEEKILHKLSVLFEDICDFSNDRDLNEDSNIEFNNSILGNLHNK